MTDHPSDPERIELTQGPDSAQGRDVAPGLDPALLALWQSQDDDVSIPDQAKLVESLRETHRRENRTLIWLNVREVTPALALAAFQIWLATEASNRQWAFLIAAATSLGVALFMIATTLQQRAAESVLGDSMRSELQRSLSQMQHRAWLYRNIAWWYLAPIALGMVMLQVGGRGLGTGGSTGTGGPLGPLEILLGVAIVGGLVALYLVNRNIGARRYDPEVERYRVLLDELDRTVR